MSTPPLTYSLERHTYTSDNVETDAIFTFGPLSVWSADNVCFRLTKEDIKATSTVLGDLVDTDDPTQALKFDDPAIESHPVLRAVLALSLPAPLNYHVISILEAHVPAIEEFIHKWDCPAAAAALPPALCLAEKQRIGVQQGIYLASLEWRFKDCVRLLEKYGLAGLGFPTNAPAGGPACMHLPYVFLHKLPPIHAHALLAGHLAEVAGKSREAVVEAYCAVLDGKPFASS